VSWQARSAPARAGVQELKADAFVIPEAEHDVTHIGAHFLAQPGDRVDVAQLGAKNALEAYLMVSAVVASVMMSAPRCR